MAGSSSAIVVARGVVKAITLAVGGLTTVLCLMSAIGHFTANGWVRVLGAVVLAVLVPAVITDRILPDDDPSRGKGVPTEVFALTWMGFAVVFVVALGSFTRGLLAKEGDRLASSGLSAVGSIAWTLAGVRAPEKATPEPLASASASAPIAARVAPSAAPTASASAPPVVEQPDAAVAAPPQQKKKDPADRTPAELFKALAPAVVSIGIKAQGDTEGGGTGFLVDDKGTLVTNHHVIAPARSLSVKFMNGAVYDDVDVLADDAARDVALLAIDLKKPKSGDPPKVEPVTLGNSDEIQVGERAISIGNPLGLDHTLTDGLVSARRVYDGKNWIQMSVPVSPGNSGGPLFDMKGRVIGVTTAQIGSMFGRAQNLNLAVPVNDVKEHLKKSYPGRHKVGESGGSSHW